MDPRLTLVLIRHAIAEDRVEFARTGRGHDQRPLTGEGRRRMRLAAAGLRRVLPELDVLASSPLERAWQTAGIVGEAYGGMPIDRLDAAASGGSEALLEMLRTTIPGTTMAVVGHEPIHGDWTGWLLTGRESGFVRFKKGEACALGFGRDIEPGSAELLWKLRPRQLRALGTRERGIGDAGTTA